MSKNYLNLSQRDPKWKNLKLGNSKGTVGQYGCYITSFANLACKTPIEVLQLAKFDQNGNVFSTSLETDVWKFRRMAQKFERETIRSLSLIDDIGIILKVSTPLAPTTGHWVLLQSLGDGGYNCIDPYPANNQDQSKSIIKFYPIAKVQKHAEFVKKI
jgi:hypothetical protein